MKHPAVFHDLILRRGAGLLDEYLPPGRNPRFVLDPFAGTGKVHELMKLCQIPIETFGIELMPKWAAMHPRTFRGDATDLDYQSRQFHGVFTSPCYGNRMADSHDANDKCSRCKGFGVVRVLGGLEVPFARRPGPSADIRCSKCNGSGLSPRRSYKHDYGEGFETDAPMEHNAGAMQWGPEYRELHALVWREVWRVLKKNGIAVVNVKDHIRDGERVRVSAWHLREMKSIGFELIRSLPIALRGNGYGANRGARVSHEYLHVLVKP